MRDAAGGDTGSMPTLGGLESAINNLTGRFERLADNLRSAREQLRTIGIPVFRRTIVLLPDLPNGPTIITCPWSPSLPSANYFPIAQALTGAQGAGTVTVAILADSLTPSQCQFVLVNNAAGTIAAGRQLACLALHQS